MAVWNACASAQFWLLKWTECYPGFAAYLQALGSLIAIGIAFFSPQIAARYMRREREAEARQSTQTFAQYLNGEMPKVQSRCSEIRLLIEEQSQPPELGMDWSDWFQKIGYVMQPGLANLIPATNNADNGPLTPFVKVTRLILDFNNKKSEYQYAPNISDLEKWNVARSELLDAIRAAGAAAASAYTPPMKKRWPWSPRAES
jgi:hypothetical protein